MQQQEHEMRHASDERNQTEKQVHLIGAMIQTYIEEPQNPPLTIPCFGTRGIYTVTRVTVEDSATFRLVVNELPIDISLSPTEPRCFHMMQQVGIASELVTPFTTTLEQFTSGQTVYILEGPHQDELATFLHAANVFQARVELENGKQIECFVSALTGELLSFD